MGTRFRKHSYAPRGGTDERELVEKFFGERQSVAPAADRKLKQVCREVFRVLVQVLPGSMNDPVLDGVADARATGRSASPASSGRSLLVETKGNRAGGRNEVRVRGAVRAARVATPEICQHYYHFSTQHYYHFSTVRPATREQTARLRDGYAGTTQPERGLSYLCGLWARRSKWLP